MNFSDLIFETHTVIPYATQAKCTFPNDWEVSVVAGLKDSGIKGDIEHDTFEVAVFRPNGNMLEDILPWQTPVQITTLMRLIFML